MTAFTTDQILDVDPAVGGQIAQSFIFELLDADHTSLGQLDVTLDSVPRVRVDTSRSVVRTCTGVVINDPPDINVFTNRVRPSLLLSNGEMLPCGVFMFGEQPRDIFSWGDRISPELFDETFLVDQPLDRTVGQLPGGSILRLFRILVDECNLPAVDIDVDDALASQSIVYKVGSSRYQTLVALAALLGCHPPYFDNSGVFRLKPLPAADEAASHVYASGTRIIAGTPRTVDSLYRAPNEYVAIGDLPGGPIVGRYRLPPAAPNSFANTGRTVTVTQSFQGLSSTAKADQAALGMALADQQSFVRAQMSAPADPRHDTFDVVDLYGDRYLERAWEMECKPGGRMTHDLVRFYEADAGASTDSPGS